MALPSVQTKIAVYFTEKINKDFKTDIHVDKVAVSLFGGVKLKNVLILDHHKDTLIHTSILKTNLLGARRILDGDLIFGDIRLTEVLFNLKTYKNEKNTNLDVFINAFDSDKPSKKPSKPFLMTAKNAYITKGHFILSDENRANPKDVDFKKINAFISDFKILGPNVTTKIHRLSFKDHRGLYVSNVSSVFSYSKEQIKLDKLAIKTKESDLYGNASLNYKIEDFAHFTDKVQFDVMIDSSNLASNDIRYFYNELGKNIHFKLRSKIDGPLNNLTLDKLRFVDSNQSKIVGKINFKNLFGNKDQEFLMLSEFKLLSTSYGNLVKILPNVLGKTLPKEIQRLGMVNLIGGATVSKTALNTNFTMVTDLGNGNADLSINEMDFIDRASYHGNVVLQDFNIGTFLGRKDLGKTSLNVAVEGKGFTQKYLNTAVKGHINTLFFNKYNYKNINVDGNFKLPYYKGNIKIKDPNLILNFNGLVDLSKRENKYDFEINVEKADLHKLKFVNDTLSTFQGNAIVAVSGNNIENLYGTIYLSNAVYVNSKSIYPFDEFTVTSEFDDDRVRTITVSSNDVISGKVVGKFRFDQLDDLVTNSVLSLYANYKPTRVTKGQFLKFNFNIYSKIVEIFYPDLNISTDTQIRGIINSDDKEFKFRLNSEKITLGTNTFDQVNVRLDNKNPLYNAYVSLDSIKTKYYKVSDFNLINVTMNDTLFVRSEFKGGNKGEDKFNLNLYHTIDEAKHNIIGIHKSEMKFKENIWYLNENQDNKNRVVFDKELKNFTIEKIILSHEDQKIDLEGVLKGDTYKDINLVFDDVDINEITPASEKFKFKGDLVGGIHFKQDKDVYQPTAAIVIKDLNINDTELGELNFNIQGNESLRKFTVDASVKNDFAESFNAAGSFEIVNKETILDMKLKMEDFKLGILGNIGGEVLSNIRGLVTGNASIVGNLKKPDVNGRLFISDAGITIPYLNVDYALNDRTIIDLTDEKFLFRNNTLTDTKFKTKGYLNGFIEHHNFTDWRLDLDVNSKKLLVLDTKDSDDAAYFGTAFINGNASIKGPIDALFIKVQAKSEKGTTIKIPINYAESVGQSSYIHFITPKEKYNLANGIVEKTRDYNGLELEFDFDITPDAEIEVILDRNSGHGMKGKGYGSLLFKINTLGKFNMWGDFQAYEGTYNFKYGGLIDKKFDVKKGGQIIWEGNPMKAQLNLEAVYKTTANPAVLLESSSFNKKVPVNVIVGLRGDLASPEPDFNIEFPTVSSVLKSEIQYKLDDKDVRQTQALYLLSSGGFLSPEGVNQSDFSGSLFETATNLLGDIIKTDNDKFNVNLNYIAADRRVGQEADGQFVANISSQVNERITINGKVGVPVGGINESAIVGDVEVQYRVSEDGSLNLRLFNRENDINYVGQGIGYTQGVGISYEVDFDTFKELVNKIFKNHKLGRASEATDEFMDSSLNPDYINFINKKKKEEEKKNSESEQKEKNNTQGLVPEED
ncbi:translocation/assembly module TamB domain-containing protein [Flavobacterium agrisoli]|uniref:Translocation/assembly module TamB n=1 Tax=Flavobacterium agrisoli TaxID=2793066 RepID=A0A934UIH6_9FLAO|nr:translocation/assembly module TamB domain-containing protein [Flavobacterium agrisoli]MBK0368448.1 translocation/assembly module TamB [Flavobacterium agrisoli]